MSSGLAFTTRLFNLIFILRYNLGLWPCVGRSVTDFKYRMGQETGPKLKKRKYFLLIWVRFICFGFLSFY